MVVILQGQIWLAFRLSPFMNVPDTLLGDVTYVHAFNKHALIINSYEAAVDLLEKRSAIYSSRPPSVMVHEL